MKEYISRLSIGKKLVLAMVLISGSITLLVTSVQIYGFYLDGLNDIDDRIIEIEQVHVPDVTERLWISDVDNIKGHLDTLIKFDGIRFIEIYDQSSLVYASGSSTGVDSAGVKVFSLSYKYKGEDVGIGRLLVYLEYDSLYEDLFVKAISTLLSNGIKTFIVGFSILVLFNYLVTRHLVTMAAYFDSLGGQAESEDLLLGRGMVSGRNDEIDVVVRSVNNMKHSTQSYLREIKNTNKELGLYQRRMEFLKELMEHSFKSEAELIQYGLVAAVNFSESMSGELVIDSNIAGEPASYIHSEDNNEIVVRRQDIVVCRKCLKNGAEIIEHEGNGVCELDDGSDSSIVRKVCVPIKSGNDIEGLLTIYNRSHSYSESDVVEIELFLQSLWNLVLRWRSQSELEQSRLNYKTLLETSSAIPWTMDIKTGTYIHVGQQVENTFGFSSEDWYRPLFQRQHIHPDDLVDVLGKQKKCIDENVDYRAKYRIYDKDGQERWLLDSGKIVTSENQSCSLQGFMFDITEQEQHDLLMRRSQKMDAMDTLAGGIAHDYNNMLGVIMGYSQLIMEKASNDDVLLKYNNHIYQAAQRGAALTAKLLKFSKQSNVSVSEVSLNMILQEDEDMLKKTLTPKVRLKFELEDELDLVYIDKNGIEDAILNLCINASHAMPSGGDLVVRTENLSLTQTEAEKFQTTSGDYVGLSVIDSGIGMSMSVQERIFDPFFSTKGEKGTGLGLSQVYGMVRSSGGVINVVSEPGHGTTMAIILPRHIGNENIMPVNAEPKQALNNGSESILVVDDEESLRDMAAEILSLRGYSVEVAESG
ncbi:MAG: ATP-binding protein, partial [Gammaproteobacteria bacterium]|nr:ATP-binding protein [Gammaproteobacteria bacterium]